jgi:hypothetical protein
MERVVSIDHTHKCQKSHGLIVENHRNTILRTPVLRVSLILNPLRLQILVLDEPVAL